MDGLRLACVYSWNCEKARLFKVSDLLLDFAKSGRGDENLIKKALALLDTDEFYQKIARDNFREGDMFNKRTVSSYWRGSPVLTGSIWHNYTTIEPIIKLPIEAIDADMINECLVHAGMVESVKDGVLEIKYRPIVKKEKELAIGSYARRSIDRVFPDSVSEGDLVAFHFFSSTEVISDNDAARLANITEFSLKKFNGERKNNIKN